MLFNVRVLCLCFTPCHTVYKVATNQFAVSSSRLHIVALLTLFIVQWMGGNQSPTSSVIAGVYGSKGLESGSNWPSSRSYFSMVADNSGYLWVFFGFVSCVRCVRDCDIGLRQYLQRNQRLMMCSGLTLPHSHGPGCFVVWLCINAVQDGWHVDSKRCRQLSEHAGRNWRGLCSVLLFAFSMRCALVGYWQPTWCPCCKFHYL